MLSIVLKATQISTIYINYIDDILFRLALYIYMYINVVDHFENSKNKN